MIFDIFIYYKIIFILHLAEKIYVVCTFYFFVYLGNLRIQVVNNV